MKKRSLFATGIMLFASLAQAGESYLYVVQPKETLSEIAHRQIPGPVWGKNGSLNKILSLNIEIKNPNRIWIGQKLAIKDSDELRQVNPSSLGLQNSSKPKEVERSIANNIAQASAPISSAKKIEEEKSPVLHDGSTANLCEAKKVEDLTEVLSFVECLNTGKKSGTSRIRIVSIRQSELPGNTTSSPHGT